MPNGSPFTICLTAGPPPLGNDECAGAIALPVVLNCANSTNGTVENATQSLPPTGRCGASPVARDVWFSFVASGPAQLITLNSPFTAVLDVRSAPCTGSASLFCNSVLGNSNSGTVVGGLTVGQTYLLRIYADSAPPPSGALSRFSVCVSAPPPGPANDECAGAVPVPVTATCASPVSGMVAGASQSLPPSVTCGFARQANDVWYSFVAGGPNQFVTLTPNFNAVFEVRSGTCASSASLFCSEVFSNNPTGTLVGGLTSGQTYYLRVYANTPFQPVGMAANFSLCLTPGPLPLTNDECAGAVPLPVTATCASPVSGTVAGASQSVPATANCGLGGVANDVWYSFVASGSTHVLTFTGQFQAVLDVRSGTCANSASIFCATAGPLPATAQFVGGLTAGQTYFLRLYANGPLPTGASAAFTICLTPGPPPPANDDCAGAIAVPVQVGTTCTMQTAGSNLTATSSMGAPVPTCAAYQGADIWYQVTVPTSGTLTVRTVVPTVGNDAGDTGMSIYSGTCGSLTQIGCDDDSGGGAKSQLSLTNRLPGEVLYVRVWGVGGGRGLFGVCATTLPPLPINDEPCGAVALPLTSSGGPLQPVASTNVGASTSTQPGIGSPTCAPTATPQDVWFSFTPGAGRSAVTLNLNGAAAGLVRVFTTPSCTAGPFTLVGCQGLGTSGQGSISLTGLTPGQLYYVAVSGYNPGDAPGPFTIIGTTMLAARGAASAFALLVYPNPSGTGQLTLRLPGAGSGSGALLDAVGRTVRLVAVPAGGGEQVLPTAGLPAGVYTLRMVTDGQVLARKVLLE